MLTSRTNTEKCNVKAPGEMKFHNFTRVDGWVMMIFSSVSIYIKNGVRLSWEVDGDESSCKQKCIYFLHMANVPSFSRMGLYFKFLFFKR